MHIPGPSCPGEKFSCVELMKQVMIPAYTNLCIWESGGDVGGFELAREYHPVYMDECRSQYLDGSQDTT